jgi:LysR family glycine cleavage system transcriptional activator
MSRSALPFHAVETFLVTARHLNLTHAARELCLTQGAVSRQIAALEAWFGFPLLPATRADCIFHRRQRPLPGAPVGIWPSDRGGRAGSSAADRGASEGADLRHSLAGSRLVAIEQRHPELQIALTTTTEHGVNFRTEPYDAAIVFGTHHSVGDLLFEEALTPVCNGALARDNMLNDVTFLHPTRDKTDWSLWLAAFSPDAPLLMRKNQHFDTMDLAITAAMQGLGVAMADATWWLKMSAPAAWCALSLSVKTGASYRLVVRSSQSKADGLARFREELVNPA